MLTRRIALAGTALLALAGCSLPGFGVNVSGSLESVEFSAFRPSGPFGLFSSPVPIAAVRVHTYSPEMTLLWEVAASGTCNPNVLQLQYGIVPAGFAQRASPPQLLPETIYWVAIDGCNVRERGGAALFKIAGGRARLLSEEEEQQAVHGAS
jgi:hypothetical protein